MGGIKVRKRLDNVTMESEVWMKQQLVKECKWPLEAEIDKEWILFNSIRRNVALVTP